MLKKLTLGLLAAVLVFAMLPVVVCGASDTQVIESGDQAVLRPIIVGDGGISEAVRQVAEQYPGCRVRLFVREHDRRYFEPYVAPERVY
ncbi:hypothetical protein V3F56_02980 [Moorellaceae bacterium AZ2]